MGFASNTKAFGEQFRGSAQNRSAAVAQIRRETQQLLRDPREWLDRVTKEHHARAKHVHAALERVRQSRQEQVNDLHQSITDRPNANREVLERMLSESRQSRQESVETLMTEFQKSRETLAADLHEAGLLWRQYSQD